MCVLSTLSAVNKPACSSIAFNKEAKHLTCPYPSGSATPLPSSCQGYSASNVSSLGPGGIIEWCLLLTAGSFCINSTAPPENIPVFLSGVSISNTGMLIIPMASLQLRNKVIECSVINLQGELCGQVRLDLINIFVVGKSV